ncbi:ABCB family ABC transporter ATP-binding protein/permease [Labrys wisconsinensis]|uniref:ATP-binding cassette subfamily B protein n=1 Tax=Labrys wisconsinensis TaxID=425677 RepID=A0ABU0J9F4_9HYPH|nr:ABC transporter ATP-binding protein/permease [Labrys wisconsinensis]MDQ0470902.1 ATP-binding cassette subfamily B protein [Labrys wisconsinensis]
MPPDNASTNAAAAKPVNADQGFLHTMAALWPYMWPKDRADLRTRVVFAFALLVVTKAVTLIVPYTFKWATDGLAAVGSGKPLTGSAFAVAMAGLPLTMIVAYGVSRLVMTAISQWKDGLFAAVFMHAVRRLAVETFQHIHGLSLRYHLERKTGGLSRVIDRGRAGIETIVRFATINILPTIVELALSTLVLVLQFDWRYAAIVLATTALYVWFTVKATEWRIAIRREMNDSDTDANQKAIDSLLNYETVKYFGNEARELARYDRALAGYEQAGIRTYITLTWLNIGQGVIFIGGMTASMALAGYGVIHGANTVGDIALLNTMWLMLSTPLNFLGFAYREIKQGVTDIETMFELLGQAPEVTDAPGAKPLEVREGRVTFDNVQFHYDPQRPILKGLSFDVPAGRTVAIVGPSGAGKSTVSRLLYRFYDVQGGRVLIDGQDVRAVTQTSLRAAIGMVPQDTVLFNDTIRYNIRYGRWDAADAEVEEAARLAQIDGFIRLMPKGYDTEVGERGLKLSGGEKQRVAIARTILKAPPILVLDEATSALDSYTEMEIQGALERVSKGRTTLVIAHRLSTVVDADEILVIDKGVVAERGTHQALLDRGGLYAGMWNRQREADEARELLKRSEEGASLRQALTV